jgi:branched-chain amino acid transport system permease protein
MANPPSGSATDTTAIGRQRELEERENAARGEPPLHADVGVAAGDGWLRASAIDALVIGIIAAVLGIVFIFLAGDWGPGPVGASGRWLVIGGAAVAALVARFLIGVFLAEPAGKRLIDTAFAGVVGLAIGLYLLGLLTGLDFWTLETVEQWVGIVPLVLLAGYVRLLLNYVLLTPPSWAMTALYDALAAGAIATAMGLFFIGMTSDTGPLRVVTRWSYLVIAVALVIGIRHVLNVAFVRNPRPVQLRQLARAAFGRAPAPSAVEAAERGGISRTLGAILRPRNVGGAFLLAAALMPFLLLYFTPDTARRDIDLGIIILTYVMLGWGLNIVVGLAGLLDLGYVAFYAVGAYSFAHLAINFDLGFWHCLPLAGILAAFWGIILGFPVLRLRGDYLAIVTLAFGEIIRLIILNWYDFTNGPNGLLGIPRPSFFGLEFERGEEGFAAYFGLEYDTIHRIVWLYYIIFALALLTNFVTLRLRKLPIGRAWEALREDEIACRSLGINTTNTKLTAFAIGAMFGGIAGCFFATRQGHISPESFTFIESATILAIVVLGGLGSQIGVVFAAIVLIGGLEWLRDTDWLKLVFGENFDPVDYRLLIFGLLMIAIMVWRPRGLVSSRNPSAVLREKKRIGAALVAQGRGG